MVPKPKAIWVVEDFLADGSIQGLVDEIRRQDMQCNVIHYFPRENEERIRKTTPINGPVLFYGSLNLGQKLRREEPWIPGAICNLPAFECTSYYAHWGKYLCNRHYVMLPTAEVYRRKDWLYSQFSIGNRIFIRPSTGFKSFSGKLFHKAEFEKDWEYVVLESKPENMLVISTPKPFLGEWRFVVADKKVISGTSYKKAGEACLEPTYPQEALEMAQEIASGDYQPDRLYVLDIAQDAQSKKFGLMEANSFSCSGLYAGNLEKIVSVASQIAIEEWEALQ